MEDIKKLLENYLSEEVYVGDDEELEFYKKVVPQTNIKDGRFLKDISLEQLFLAFYNFYSKKSFQLVKHEVPFLTEKLISNHLQLFCFMLDSLQDIDTKEIEEFLLFYKGKLSIKDSTVHLKNIMKGKVRAFNASVARLMKAESNDSTVSSTIKFLEFYLKATEEEKIAFEKIRLFLNVKMIIEDGGIKELSDIRKEIVNQMVDEYNNFVSYEDKLKKAYKNRIREQVKIKDLYAKRYKSLQGNITDSYLRLTPEEMEKYPINFLERIETAFLQHNADLYKKFKNKLNILNGNKQEQIKKVFLDKKVRLLNRDLLDELTAIVSTKELEQKLELYIQLKISLDDIKLFQLIKNVPLNVLEFLRIQFERMVLSQQFIEKNLVEFEDENIVFKINEIIELLKALNIEIKKLDELILIDTKALKSKIKLAQQYGVELREKSALFTLIQDDFFDALDIWIEQGLYKYINNNLAVLNKEAMLVTKRMVICQKISVNPFDESGKIKPFILDETKFFISNVQLDECLANVSSFFVSEENRYNLRSAKRDKIDKSTLIDDSFNQSAITFQVGNQLISKMKVLRNLASLPNGNLQDAILYGSIFELNQCEDIINHLNQDSILLQRNTGQNKL